MHLKQGVSTLVAVIIGIVVNVPVQASVHFEGVSGSYAASDAQLAGGQNLTNWTMELWVKPEAIRNQGLFNNLPNVPWTGNQWSLNADGSFGFLDTWNQPQAYWSVASAPGTITTNEWQLLSVVADGNSFNAFRNGVLVGTAQYPGNASFAGVHQPNTLGAFDFGVADYFTLPDAGFYASSLADFRLWNRALTGQELLAHVAAEPALNALGLTDWIPFNETTGNEFHDLVSGITGTLYAATFSPDSPAMVQIPHRATGTAQIVNGFVVGVTITDPGYGYTNNVPPVVLIRDDSGTNATAHAVVANGAVQSIVIDNPGTGYSADTIVRIAPPPFSPTLSISVKTVSVEMSVVLGRKYQLDVSTDMVNWSSAEPPFIAQDDTITQEFNVTDTGRFFRIQEVP